MERAEAQSSTELDAARLIEKHQAGIWRYLRSLGCESATAEDLTQDTFIQVITRPFRDYGDASTATYLRKTAKNLFISYMRRNGRMKVVEDITGFDEVWEKWIQDDSGDELLETLRLCLAALTERARLAMRMRYSEQANRNEIAEALEITEHGAKNLMQRAKKQLKECIEHKVASEAD
ncbi:MAG: sigma-70 family RNA polymerase sigma factor [bacterium]|nr:sigma-70 family RNA polymerase sigma factor [bacterium]